MVGVIFLITLVAVFASLLQGMTAKEVAKIPIHMAGGIMDAANYNTGVSGPPSVSSVVGTGVVVSQGINMAGGIKTKSGE